MMHQPSNWEVSSTMENVMIDDVDLRCEDQWSSCEREAFDDRVEMTCCGF
jgi:hypothetical protein